MVDLAHISLFISALEFVVQIYEDLSTACEQIQEQRRQLQFIVLQRPTWLGYLATPGFFQGLSPAEENLILAEMRNFGDAVRSLEAQLNERQGSLPTWTGLAGWWLGSGTDANALHLILITAERLNRILNDRASLWLVINMKDVVAALRRAGNLNLENADSSDGSDSDYGDDGDDASHDAGHKVHKRDAADSDTRAKTHLTKIPGSGAANNAVVVVSHRSHQSLHSSRGFLLLIVQASSLEKVWSDGCCTSPVEDIHIPDEVLSLLKDLVKASGKDSWKDYTVQQWLVMGSFYLAAAHQNFSTAPGCSESKGKAFGLLILAHWAVLCIYRHPQSPASISPVPTKQMEWEQHQRLEKLVREAFDICDSWFGVEKQRDIIKNIRACIDASGETKDSGVGTLWRFHLPDPPGDRAISPVSLLGRRLLDGLRLCSVSTNPVSGPKEQICRKAVIVLPRQDEHECYSDNPVVLACVCGKHQLHYYITECTEVLVVRSVYIDVKCLKANQGGNTVSSIRVCCKDEQHAQSVSREIAIAKCQLAKGRLDAYWDVVLSQTPRSLRVGRTSFDSQPCPEDGDDLAIGWYQLALGTLSSRGTLQLLSAPLSFQFTIPSGWEIKRHDRRRPAIVITFKLLSSPVTLNLSFLCERDCEAFFRQYLYLHAFPDKSKTLNGQDFHQWRISNRALSLPDDDGGKSLLVMLRGGRSGFIFNTTHLNACLVFQLLESNRKEVIFLRPSPAGFEEFYIKRARVYPLSRAVCTPPKPAGLTVKLFGEGERATFRATVDWSWAYIAGIPVREARVTMHAERGRGAEYCKTYTGCPTFLEIFEKPADRVKKMRLCIFAPPDGQLSTYTHKLVGKRLSVGFETVKLSELRCDEHRLRISLALRFETNEQAMSVFRELKKPI